jgi:hypothetical protein
VFRIRIEHLDFAARTIFNPFGKTKAARRKVTMTEDVYALLRVRAAKAKGQFDAVTGKVKCHFTSDHPTLG